MNKYLTLAAECEGLYKDRGSKFIAYAFRAEGESEMITRLQNLREIHPKAVHHCWAWRGRDIERQSDDGEPSGTAGKPILGQLHRYTLNEVGIVVVRYYGGVKLGTGGLIKAYKNAADLALQQAEIIEMEIRHSIYLSYGYEYIAQVEGIIRRYGWPIADQSYGENPAIRWSLAPQDIDDAIITIKAHLLNCYPEQIAPKQIVPGCTVSIDRN